MTTEEMCRQLLRVAIDDKIIASQYGPPEEFTAGDLAGMANLLNKMLWKAYSADDERK